MIPEHLQGKSATQIVDEMKAEFLGVETGNGHALYHAYINKLNMLLLLAVKDALCNADLARNDFQTTVAEDAEQRAIAFLNMVLPAEK